MVRRLYAGITFRGDLEHWKIIFFASVFLFSGKNGNSDASLSFQGILCILSNHLYQHNVRGENKTRIQEKTKKHQQWETASCQVTRHRRREREDEGIGGAFWAIHGTGRGYMVRGIARRNTVCLFSLIEGLEKGA